MIEELVVKFGVAIPDYALGVVMPITLHTDPMPLRVDESGAVRVGKSRVTLDVLLEYRRLGMTPEEIAAGLDTLTLADVHGAFAYYFRHQAELDDYLLRRSQEAEQLRQHVEATNASRLAEMKARFNVDRSQRNGGRDPTSD